VPRGRVIMGGVMGGGAMGGGGVGGGGVGGGVWGGGGGGGGWGVARGRRGTAPGEGDGAARLAQLDFACRARTRGARLAWREAVLTG